MANHPRRQHWATMAFRRSGKPTLPCFRRWGAEGENILSRLRTESDITGPTKLDGPVMPDEVIERKPNGQFAHGSSGNLGGNAQRTRHMFNKAFLEALAKDFREGGPQAIAKVRKHQPAAYMKICALLVPREMKVEHSGSVSQLSDEQLDLAIEAIKAMLAARAGDAANTIEGKPAALPDPMAVP